MAIKGVWSYNFETEISAFDRCLHRYPVISIDTEFPGFLFNSGRNSPETLRYSHMRVNVDELKLIQLGVTLSDNYGNVGGTWEFNFCDFDEEKDVCDISSIEFLKKNGIDLDEIKREGVSIDVFAPIFSEILATHSNLKWVTFHGIYDLAYVFKFLTKKPMPVSAEEFAMSIGKVFGFVYDVKFMAGCCRGLVGLELGLERLASILGVERLGGAHHAGSDSLLTALVFAKMKVEVRIQESAYQGFLYGLSTRVVRMRMRPSVVLVQSPMSYCCYPVVYPPPLIVYGTSSPR